MIFSLDFYRVDRRRFGVRSREIVLVRICAGIVSCGRAPLRNRARLHRTGRFERPAVRRSKRDGGRRPDGLEFRDVLVVARQNGCHLAEAGSGAMLRASKIGVLDVDVLQLHGHAVLDHHLGFFQFLLQERGDNVHDFLIKIGKLLTHALSDGGKNTISVKT